MRDANTLTATIRIQNNRILNLTDPTASIVIPTRARPDYLRVALASIAPQAAAAGAELLVVEDDQPSPDDPRARRALRRRLRLPHATARAERRPQHRRRPLTRRTAGVRRRRRRGWPRLAAGTAPRRPRASRRAGPHRPHPPTPGGPPRWSRRSCGREGPPITSLDLGTEDTDHMGFAWGANMTVRRSGVGAGGALRCGAGERRRRAGVAGTDARGISQRRRADHVHRRRRARPSALACRRAPTSACPRGPCPRTRQPTL